MGISFKQVAQLVAGSACLTGLGTLIYANQVEPKRFQLETVSLTTSGGAGEELNLRILHLSDLHLCLPESEKMDFIRKATDDDYDLVFLTGDIFENFTGIAYAPQLLTRKPRLGAYAVLGNHDYFNYTLFNKTLGRIARKFRTPKTMRDVTPMVKALEKGGFQVLRNQAASLVNEGVHIVGIDYPTIQHVKLRELVEQADEDQFVIVLFHVPIFLDRICTSGAHLAVGGHTHVGPIPRPRQGRI